MRNFSVMGCALVMSVLAGCQSLSTKPVGVAPVVVRFHLETLPEMSEAVQLPQSGVGLNVAPKPVFNEYDIGNAEVARVEMGPCLLVQLTPAAIRDLYRLSVSAQGRRLVLSLDGVFLGVHRIDHAMADGLVPVFLEVEDDQLPVIVARIKFTSTEMARAVRKNANL